MEHTNPAWQTACDETGTEKCNDISWTEEIWDRHSSSERSQMVTLVTSERQLLHVLKRQGNWQEKGVSLKEIQERCAVQNKTLYVIFEDFTKAFDVADRKTLWKILLKLGFPTHFTNLVSAQHTDMKATVRLQGKLSNSFGVVNGIKQGCVLVPILFSIF